MPISMTSVKSASISGVGYRRRTMKVEFSSGRVYEYRKVPRATYDKFLKADSKGKFFNAEIRDKYSEAQV